MISKFAASVCIAVFFTAFAVIPLSALNIADDEAEHWLQLLGADLHRIESAFGSSHTDIDPDPVNSRAERIIWYESGPTIWFSNGEAVQLRIDSSSSFAAAGLRFGVSPAGVRDICGQPWIESTDSLYYNLSWRGGPVRLRFLFNENGLDEIYLYYVR